MTPIPWIVLIDADGTAHFTINEYTARKVWDSEFQGNRSRDPEMMAPIMLAMMRLVIATESASREWGKRNTRRRTIMAHYNELKKGDTRGPETDS